MADIIAKNGHIVIRKMKETREDFQLFLKWMTDPQTMKFWEGMTEKFTYERVAQNYAEHVREQVEQCLIEYEGRAIGYCQFCVLDAQGFEVPEEEFEKFAGQSKAYGIDIFLGEVECRDHGIGTQCLKALMKALFEEWGADVLMIDPKIHNTRAIRCYQKCGFRNLFVVPQRELQDGIRHDSQIMGVKKPDFMRDCDVWGRRRREMAEIIGITASDPASPVPYRIIKSDREDGYTRQLIEYDSGQDKVPAFLLIPEGRGPHPAVLIHHQHNREHHLGKSEVCGLAGDPLQAFGPALAKRGFVVLAPDSVCFEDRRRGSLAEGFDFWQHFDEMCYRIVRGDYLMKKVLEDAVCGITLLAGLAFVDSERIGTLGHSYGGNTVLFLCALDGRIAFGCASGSACTYETRMKNGTGIEMASVIPNFHGKYDIDDLVSCIAPRRFLIVSAREDKYSADAPDIVAKALPAWHRAGAPENLCHRRYPGAHAMTRERFDDIIEWLTQSAASYARAGCV